LACYKVHKEACQVPKPSTEANVTSVANESLTSELSSVVETLNATSEKKAEIVDLNLGQKIRPDMELSDTSGDLLAGEALRCLEESDELRALLANKHLRELMIDLNQRGDVTVDKKMEKFMQEPLFQEFSETCLNLIQKK